jgi:peptidoglycan/xylan/chitin deacetylase (PgdA/CDA1 family)
VGEEKYDCNDGKFDMLYREGGKMMNIPLHTRIIGKPGRCEALRKFMLYIKEKEGVWVTTRRDIAKHMHERFPYRTGRRWMEGVEK